jgi:hypothetical protein
VWANHLYFMINCLEVNPKWLDITDI